VIAIRSNLRKLPVNAAARMIPAASTTATSLGTPRYPAASVIPMNSVTMVSALRMKQVDDRERAPELAEPLQDQPGMPDAGDRPEPEHHFLVHVQHRDQSSSVHSSRVP